MIIGMTVFIFAMFTAQYFQGPVGDNLIGIHIGGGTRATLYDIDNKIFEVLASTDFIASPDYRITDFMVENAKFIICHSRRFLDRCQGIDKAGELTDHDAGDGEVIKSPHRLHAIERIQWHLAFAQAVGFKSVFHLLCASDNLCICQLFIEFHHPCHILIAELHTNCAAIDFACC